MAFSLGSLEQLDQVLYVAVSFPKVMLGAKHKRWRTEMSHEGKQTLGSNVDLVGRSFDIWRGVAQGLPPRSTGPSGRFDDRVDSWFDDRVVSKDCEAASSSSMGKYGFRIQTWCQEIVSKNGL